MNTNTTLDLTKLDIELKESKKARLSGEVSLPLSNDNNNGSNYVLENPLMESPSSSSFSSSASTVIKPLPLTLTSPTSTTTTTVTSNINPPSAPKKSLSERFKAFIYEKLTKKDEGKGGMNLSVSTLIGSEYSIVFDNPEILSLETFLERLKKSVVNDPSNNLVIESMDAFYSMLSRIAIVSHKPHTTKIHSLSAAKVFSSFGNLRVLNLEGHLELNSIPPEISQLKNLEELVMKRMNIHQIPQEICSLTKLKSLDFSCNAISSLPFKDFGNLILLESLILSENSIYTLSKDFLQLKSLNVLDLQKNKLDITSVLNTLAELVSIQTKAVIETNNETTTSSTSLTSKANRLSMGCRGGPLRVLLIGGNKLNPLPSSLTQLHTLEVLDLSYGEISTFPYEIFSTLTKLTSLNISHNAITSLKDTLQNEPSSSSLLSSIPKNFGFQEKIYSALGVSNTNNSQSKLPHDSILLNLHKLDISHNMLSTFPQKLCQSLPSLTDLDISHNRFASLPVEINQLTTLNNLHANNNNFQGTVPLPILTLPFLHTLSLSSNAISEWWPDLNNKNNHFFTGLISLDLRANKLRKVGKSVGRMTSLRLLDLGNNSITEISSEIEKLTSLHTLNLDNNPLNVLPSEITKLPSLKRISVANISVFEENPENKEVKTLHGDKVQLNLLVKQSLTAPHSLLVYALSHFANDESLHLEFKEARGIEAIFTFLTSPILVNQINSAKAIWKLSFNEAIKEYIFEVGGQLLLEMCKACDKTCQLFILNTIGNLAFVDSIRKSILSQYPIENFIRLGDENQEIRKKCRRILAILGINDYFLDKRCKYDNVNDVDTTKKTKVRVLCLDGGGTRGIVTIEMLKKIEELTGKPIHELFDLICGTSTGAQLAVAISFKKYPLVDYERIYKDLCTQVFSTVVSNTPVPASDLLPSASINSSSSSITPLSSSTNLGSSVSQMTTNTPTSNATSSYSLSSTISSHWSKLSLYSNVITTGAFYKSKNYEDLLLQIYGDTSLIDTVETTNVKFFAVSTFMNTVPAQSYLFRNYVYPENSQSRYPGGCTSTLVIGLRASTAAPSYFDEVLVGTDRFQDGGVVANNPSAIAYHEAKRIWGPNVEIEALVSLGTGRPSSVKRTKNSYKDTLSIIIDSATNSQKVHDILEDFMKPGEYFRFNPQDDIFYCDLDETNPKILSDMQIAAQKYIHSNINEFEELANKLKREVQ